MMQESLDQSMEQTVAPKAGVFERIKETLNPDALAQRFNLTKSRMLEMGLYLLVGFIAGFLLKKYSRFVFAAALIIILFIILHQFNILTLSINWAQVRETLGIAPSSAAPDASLLNVYWEWVKMNVGLVLSFSIGFLIGLRLA